MKHRSLGWLLLGLTLSACGGGATHVSLEVVFPDAQSREDTVRLELAVMRPGAGADCAALLDGSATPGAAGYEVLDQLTVLLPSLEGARALEVAEAGPVLFYGLGLDTADAPVVHGCLAAEASGDVDTVTLALVRVGPPCTQTSDCTNADWCDGEETCLNGRCQAGSRDCADADACTQDVCNEADDRCDHPPVTTAPPTEGAPGDATCADALDNDCDGLTDGADDDCAECSLDGDCDDGLWCSGDETCAAGSCADGTPRACSDDDACTQDVCNEDFDRCDNPPLAEPPGTEGPVGDATCTDTLDNDCDGLTDADDTACVSCTNDNECDDLNPCTTDTCAAGVCGNVDVADGTGCDDGEYCTDPDTCVGGLCGGVARDCSGVADPCNTGACDELADTCAPVPVLDDTPCDDGQFCSATDLCQAGACVGGVPSPCGGDCVAGCDEDANACTPAAPGTPCTQDGVFCNGAEECDAAGACIPPGDPCGADECGACNEGTGACDVSPGAACAGDGVDCTTNHECDAAGQCVGTVQDDAYCDALSPGSLCLPDCSADASGCVLAPTGVALTCQSPVDLGAGTDSACELQLSGPGGAGQGACLACQAALGDVLLARTTFDDGAGGCTLDGWSLVSGGGTCNNTLPADCSQGTLNRTCCSTLGSLCDTASFGRPVLRSDSATNCGGGSKQWRLTRTFDLSGLRDAKVCFEAADDGASVSSGLSVSASAPGQTTVALACLLAGPQPGVNNALTPRCADLPAWADGNAAVTLTVRAHSNADGEQIFLGGVSLRAWSAGCAPAPVTALDATFDGCDLGAWSVLSGAVACDSTGCSNQTVWRPGVVSDGAAASLETRVDASGLHGGLELCFQMGSLGAAAGDGLAIAVDAGTGYQVVFAQDAPLGLGGECQELCLPLGDALPAAARNPDLGIRLDLTGNQTVGVYGLRLSGSPGCAAGGAVTLSGPVDAGGGRYTFAATDAAGAQLGASVACEWTPDPTLQDVADIWFMP